MPDWLPSGPVSSWVCIWRYWLEITCLPWGIAYRHTGPSWEMYMYVGNGKYLSSTESAHGFFGYWQGSTGEPKRPAKYLLCSKKDPFSLFFLNPNFCAIVQSYAMLTLPIKTCIYKFLLFAPWLEQKQITYIRSQCWAPAISIECWAHFRAPFYVWSGA